MSKDKRGSATGTHELNEPLADFTQDLPPCFGAELPNGTPEPAKKKKRQARPLSSPLQLMASIERRRGELKPHEQRMVDQWYHNAFLSVYLDEAEKVDQSFREQPK